jgi:hypothetical protein
LHLLARTASAHLEEAVDDRVQVNVVLVRHRNSFTCQ